MVKELAALAVAVGTLTGKEIPGILQAAVSGVQAGASHQAIAELLKGGDAKMLILGQTAMAHEQASWLRQLSAWIAGASGAALNIVSHGGNYTGAAMVARSAGALDGLNTREMLSTPLKGYLLWDIEPEFDLANPAQAMQALASAERVVAVSAFASDGLKAVADVILPLAPLAESEGTVLYALMDSRLQWRRRSAHQVRPGLAGKFCAVWATQLELEGFSQVDIGALREEMLAEHQSGGPVCS